MTYDYIIVGAGLSGAVFAEQATRAGKSCYVIDKRNHIAGNCYTERQHNIDVHMYGPHLFHTSNKDVWTYVNRFATFNGYIHQVMAKTDKGILSLPINLHTMYDLFGIHTPQQMQKYLEDVSVKDADDSTIEGWCLKNIGPDLYTLFMKEYTKKQWNKDPKHLPASIVKRLPLRSNWNNRYFRDTYEGIPEEGYTQFVQNILDGVDVELGVDYTANVDYLRSRGRRVVYTGSCDALFGYEFGKMEYRSISMQHEIMSTPDYMGIGQLNDTTAKNAYTRTIEHKHFNPRPTDVTIVSREFSSSDGEPYYPIHTKENDDMAKRYFKMAQDEGYIVMGRLGNYQYWDMHQAIAHSLKIAKEELNGY